MVKLQKNDAMEKAARPSLLIVSLKIGIIALSSFICQMQSPTHPKRMFVLGMLIGIFLEELIPPRGKLLLPLLTLAGAVALALKLIA